MTTNHYLRSTTPTDRFVGRCVDCDRPVSAPLPDYHADLVTVACPDCDRPVSAERIYGTVTGMACDPRCEGATGTSCDCGCGGKNHGGIWSQRGEAVASQITRLRDQRARRAEQAAKRQAAKQAREKATVDDNIAAYTADRPDIMAWLNANVPTDDFAASLYHAIERYGQLTERQEAAVLRNIERDRRQAQWDAEQAERDAKATDVPAGKHTVEGTILTVKTEDNPFGYGCVVKMLVDCGTYRLWGTKPTSLDDARRGFRVRFTANLEPRERGFGFFKRPTKAEIVPVTVAV